MLITVSPSLTSLHLAEPFFNSRRTPFYIHPEIDSTGTSDSAEKIDYPLASLLHETNAEQENKPCLQNLHSAYLIPTGDDVDSGLFYRRFDLKGVLGPLNRLPSIDSVGTELLEDYAHGWPGPTLDSCNFSRICIYNPSLDTMYLAGLIVPSETLREFWYSVGERATVDAECPSFNPKTLLKALCGHKKQ